MNAIRIYVIWPILRLPLFFYLITSIIFATHILVHISSRYGSPHCIHFFWRWLTCSPLKLLFFCLIPKKSDRFVFLFNQISMFSSNDIERKSIKLFIISIELFVVQIIDVCHRWPFNLLCFVPIWFVTNRKATQSNIEH